jgi:hypothetical protein
MIRPAHFFVGLDLALEWEHVPSEELVWEIFQGRLLDPAHTRQRRSFEAWNVYSRSDTGRSAEPLLSLKLDADAGQLHVVRGLDSYVWEGYDAGGNIYQSRERRKWVRELVATLHLDRFADLDELRDELACRLLQAVVGTSRLPLASVETPLPSFSFGQLLYCYRPTAPESAESPRRWRELLKDMLASFLHPREQAHLLETFLHAASLAEMSDAAAAFVGCWTEMGRTTAELAALLRTLFNEVSLSPYTDLVEKTKAFLHVLEGRGLLSMEQVVDFLSYLLRHLGRHLTAYDLVVFHHRGANYPDALMLDAVVKDYLMILRRRPELFLDAPADSEETCRSKRMRRRALRQGWLLRRRYEGHPVPDLPTSPGENMRVLPPSHPRVAEEQINQPARRTRRLYASDPLPSPSLSFKPLSPGTPGERGWGEGALPPLTPNPSPLSTGERGESRIVAQALRQSLDDLVHAEEWRELGLAVFLDRPFGAGKAATEPDGTLLLSAEAFSAAIAWQRRDALAHEVGLRSDDTGLPASEVHGLPLDAIGGAARPGTVSLADARRAAADFVFLRTTPASARALLGQFDFTPLTRRFRLEDVLTPGNLLLARSAVGAELVLYDAQLRPRVQLEVDTHQGYRSRGGEEYPAGGLLGTRVWETAPDGEMLPAYDLREEPIRLPPR